MRKLLIVIAVILVVVLVACDETSQDKETGIQQSTYDKLSKKGTG